MIGRLGADATSRVLTDGTHVVNFSLADSKRWVDKDTGEEREKTKWVSCSIFRKQGQSTDFVKHLKVGMRIYIMGSVNANSYTNEKGEYKTGLQCNVDIFEILFDKLPKDE